MNENDYTITAPEDAVLELKARLRAWAPTPDELAAFYARQFGMDLELLPEGKVCDFCALPGPFPCKTYLSHQDVPSIPDTSGLWAACLPCHALIQESLTTPEQLERGLPHGWHAFVQRCVDGIIARSGEDTPDRRKDLRMNMGVIIGNVFDERVIVL